MQTCAVPVDFNDGEAVYQTIREKIIDKDIGILGKNLDCFKKLAQFLNMLER